jgi:hypothetical protein
MTDSRVCCHCPVARPRLPYPFQTLFFDKDFSLGAAVSNDSSCVCFSCCSQNSRFHCLVSLPWPCGPGSLFIACVYFSCYLPFYDLLAGCQRLNLFITSLYSISPTALQFLGSLILSRRLEVLSSRPSTLRISHFPPKILSFYLFCIR